MSVTTYPTTYPPGVLTGRPMEMFEATPTCDIYAVPEQWTVGDGDLSILEELTDALRERDLGLDWDMDEIQELLVGLESIPDGEWIETGKNHSWSATPTIAATALGQFEEDFDYEESLRMNNIEEVDMEMEEALDAIDQEKEEEMDWIEQQLQLLDRYRHVCRHTGWRYQDKTDYYRYPMVWDGGFVVLHDFFSSFGIKEALQQFEEDFDYEQSLWEENKACEEQKINLHRLLACEDVTKRPGWCGSLCPYDETTQQERYIWDVEMITSFPQNRKGYALGKTPYGLVFYPETFRNYHPGIGGVVQTTVALQDSQKMEQSTRSFPFTAIYLH